MTEGEGGVVFRVGRDLRFLPASTAMKVMAVPEMARVPGGPPELRGVALVDGSMIPVVDVLEACGEDPGEDFSTSNRAMLVCGVLGEYIGLVGMTVLMTGRFEVTPSGEVTFDGERANPFDLGAIIAGIREGRWAV